jgi:hypothetical protein
MIRVIDKEIWFDNQLVATISTDTWESLRARFVDYVENGVREADEAAREAGYQEGYDTGYDDALRQRGEDF